MNDGGGYKALFWVQVSEQFPSDREGRRPVMIRLPLILLSKIALKVFRIGFSLAWHF